MDLATLNIQVNTSQVKDAADQLNTFAESAGEAEKATDSLKKTWESMSKASGSTGLEKLTDQELKRYCDEMDRASQATESFSQKVNRVWREMSEGARKDLDSLTQKVNDSEKTHISFGSTIMSMVPSLAALAAGYISLKAAIDFLKGSAEQFMEQEVALNRLTVAMKNSKSYTSEGIESFKQFADVIQQTTTVSDNAAISIMSIMKSYGMSNEEVKKATQASLDFASAKAAEGLSAETAARLIARAYEGHTERLSRYGIEVDRAASASQKFESVLSQVTAKFSGSAASDLDTYRGKIQQISNEWSSFQANIGQIVMQLSGPFISAMKDVVSLLKETSGWWAEAFRMPTNEELWKSQQQNLLNQIESLNNLKETAPLTGDLVDPDLEDKISKLKISYNKLTDAIASLTKEQERANVAASKFVDTESRFVQNYTNQMKGAGEVKIFGLEELGKEKDKIQEIVKEYENKTAMLGMTKQQQEVYNAIVKAGAATESEGADAIRKSISAYQEKAIAVTVDEYEKKATTLRMTTNELEIYNKVLSLGLTMESKAAQPVIASMRALQSKQDAIKNETALLDLLNDAQDKLAEAQGVSQTETEKYILMIEDLAAGFEDLKPLADAAIDRFKQLGEVTATAQADEQIRQYTSTVLEAMGSQEDAINRRYDAEIERISKTQWYRELEVSNMQKASEVLSSLEAARATELAKVKDTFSKDVERVWDQALRNIQDSIGEAFKSIFDGELDNWEDFGDKIVDIMKDTAAQIVAMWVQQKIMLPAVDYLGLNPSKTGGAGGGAGEDIGKVISGATGSMGGFFSSIYEGAADALGDPATSLEYASEDLRDAAEALMGSSYSGAGTQGSSFNWGSAIAPAIAAGLSGYASGGAAGGLVSAGVALAATAAFGPVAGAIAGMLVSALFSETKETINREITGQGFEVWASAGMLSARQYVDTLVTQTKTKGGLFGGGTKTSTWTETTYEDLTAQQVEMLNKFSTKFSLSMERINKSLGGALDLISGATLPGAQKINILGLSEEQIQAQFNAFLGKLTERSLQSQFGLFYDIVPQAVADMNNNKTIGDYVKKNLVNGMVEFFAQLGVEKFLFGYMPEAKVPKQIGWEVPPTVGISPTEGQAEFTYTPEYKVKSPTGQHWQPFSAEELEAMMDEIDRKLQTNLKEPLTEAMRQVFRDVAKAIPNMAEGMQDKDAAFAATFRRQLEAFRSGYSEELLKIEQQAAGEIDSVIEMIEDFMTTAARLFPKGTGEEYSEQVESAQEALQSYVLTMLEGREAMTETDKATALASARAEEYRRILVLLFPTNSTEYENAARALDAWETKEREFIAQRSKWVDQEFEDWQKRMSGATEAGLIMEKLGLSTSQAMALITDALSAVDNGAINTKADLEEWATAHGLTYDEAIQAFETLHSELFKTADAVDTLAEDLQAMRDFDAWKMSIRGMSDFDIALTQFNLDMESARQLVAKTSAEKFGLEEFQELARAGINGIVLTEDGLRSLIETLHDGLTEAGKLAEDFTSTIESGRESVLKMLGQFGDYIMKDNAGWLKGIFDATNFGDSEAVKSAFEDIANGLNSGRISAIQFEYALERLSELFKKNADIEEKRAQKEEDLANQRQSLELEILQLEEDTVEIRRRELEALDQSLVPLQQRIWALQEESNWLSVISNLEAEVEDGQKLYSEQLAELNDRYALAFEKLKALGQWANEAGEQTEIARLALKALGLETELLVKKANAADREIGDWISAMSEITDFDRALQRFGMDVNDAAQLLDEIKLVKTSDELLVIARRFWMGTEEFMRFADILYAGLKKLEEEADALDATIESGWKSIYDAMGKTGEYVMGDQETWLTNLLESYKDIKIDTVLVDAFNEITDAFELGRINAEQFNYSIQMLIETYNAAKTVTEEVTEAVTEDMSALEEFVNGLYGMQEQARLAAENEFAQLIENIELVREYFATLGNGISELGVTEDQFNQLLSSYGQTLAYGQQAMTELQIATMNAEARIPYLSNALILMGYSAEQAAAMATDAANRTIAAAQRQLDAWLMGIAGMSNMDITLKMLNMTLAQAREFIAGLINPANNASAAIAALANTLGATAADVMGWISNIANDIRQLDASASGQTMTYKVPKTTTYSPSSGVSSAANRASSSMNSLSDASRKLEERFNALQGAFEEVQDMIDELTIGELAPAQSYEKMQYRYEGLVKAIKDATSEEDKAKYVQELHAFLPEYLEFMNAFGINYESLTNSVLDDLRDMEVTFKTQLDYLAGILENTSKMAGYMGSSASSISGGGGGGGALPVTSNGPVSIWDVDRQMTHISTCMERAWGTLTDLLGSGMAAAEEADAIITSTTNITGAPGAKISYFQYGGYHRGGWRVTGERGPELEFTGASRVYNSEDSAGLIANAVKKAIGAGGGGPITVIVKVGERELKDIVVETIPRAIRTDSNVQHEMRRVMQ